MSYNGSGVFNINTAGQPVVTGTVISSTAFNALTSDLGTGLSTAITKDGQTTATARIPFAAGINSSLVTDATSTTTGSIITAGGAGIAKALYVGTTGQVGTTLGVGAATPSASGAGITFPATQSASTDANTLDDYEEGTWTPSLGGGATGTFAGTYVKVGKLVTLHGSISVTLIVAGSTRVITGVPFSAASGGSGCITAEYTTNLATAITSIFGYVYSSSINIDSRTGAAVSASSNAIFGNGTAFDFTCTYISTT